MNPFWVVVISILVLVPLFIFNDRVWEPRRMKRRMEKFPRDLRDGKIKPPHYDVTILFDPTGFGCRDSKSADPLPRMSWGEVIKVTAYKRDLFSTDLICVFLSRADETGMEIHEEMNNWMDFIRSLPKYLPGCKQTESWLRDVTFPAFATNLTELFSRSNKSEGAK